MDAPTISAFAAAAAAVGAFTVAGIQLFVGYRQSKAALRSAEAAMLGAKNAGRHTVAEFRQAWIYKVIDTLRDHHSILMNKPAGQRPTSEENKALTASRTQLEILLNPNETDTIALLTKINEIDKSITTTERDGKAVEMLTIARTLLKREWVRLRDELEKQ
jgi:uncharacterized protein YdcH (DUF465 family)